MTSASDFCLDPRASSPILRSALLPPSFALITFRLPQSFVLVVYWMVGRSRFSRYSPAHLTLQPIGLEQHASPARRIWHVQHIVLLANPPPFRVIMPVVVSVLPAAAVDDQPVYSTLRVMQCDALRPSLASMT